MQETLANERFVLMMEILKGKDSLLEDKPFEFCKFYEYYGILNWSLKIMRQIQK